MGAYGQGSKNQTDSQDKDLKTSFEVQEPYLPEGEFVLRKLGFELIPGVFVCQSIRVFGCKEKGEVVSGFAVKVADRLVGSGYAARCEARTLPSVVGPAMASDV